MIRRFYYNNTTRFYIVLTHTLLHGVLGELKILIYDDIHIIRIHTI